MYYIIIKRGNLKMEYLTVHRDKTDALALIDITTEPYFLEDEKSDAPQYFEEIISIVEYLKKTFKVKEVKVAEVDHMFYLGDVKESSMITY